MTISALRIIWLKLSPENFNAAYLANMFSSVDKVTMDMNIVQVLIKEGYSTTYL
jgi:hypothetical protein